jgi:hypothetical protein
MKYIAWLGTDECTVTQEFMQQIGWFLLAAIIIAIILRSRSINKSLKKKGYNRQRRIRYFAAAAVISALVFYFLYFIWLVFSSCRGY